MARARVRYYVLSHQGKWQVRREGVRLGELHDTQASAIEAARGEAKLEHASGTDTQLLIQRPNGEWRTEWTYGDDPEKTKG